MGNPLQEVRTLPQGEDTPNIIVRAKWGKFLVHFRHKEACNIPSLVIADVFPGEHTISGVRRKL